MKRHIITLLKYGLGVSILTWVVWSNWDLTSPTGEPVGLSSALQRPVRVGPLLLAFLLCTGGVFLTFVRWYVLVRAQELPFTLPNALRLGMVGYFFNTLLPGAVGGDIIKATCIAREQSRRTVAVATVLIDRAIGLCGLFYLVTLVGGLFWWTGILESLVKPESVAALETIVVGSSFVVGGSLAFWILLGFLPSRRVEIFAGRLIKIPKIGASLAEFWRAVWLYRCRGRHVGTALVLAIIGHVGFVSTFYFAAQVLTPVEQIPSYGTHYLLVPVGLTIQAGFPAPGGVGGGEYAFGMLYGLLGSVAAFGVLGSLTKRVVEWLLGILCYLAYLRMKPELLAQKTAEPAAGNGATGAMDIAAASTADSQASPPASAAR